MEDPLLIIKMAELTLEKVKRPLSSYEIWEEGKKLGLAQRVKSTGKTPWRSLGAQIYVDIRDNPNTLFYQPSKRPAKFYLKRLSNGEIIIPITEKERKTRYSERDLHPLLCTFVNRNPHFQCQVRTIFHEITTNRKKGYNEWLHPDLVGVYFPFKDYSDVTLKIQKSLSLSSVKLFSFELKKELNFGNLRNSYFQAVSNSSWANEGYLVVLNMADEPQLIDEIQRLNNSFGIGLIKLNPEIIDESEIIFASRINNELDWDTIDRLAEDNKDFNCFIQDVIEDIQIGKIKGSYDIPMNDEKLIAFMKEKEII